MRDLEMPTAADSDIWVLRSLRVCADSLLYTRQEPMLFQDFLLRCPRSEKEPSDRATGAEGGRKAPAGFVDQLRNEFPWLRNSDISKLAAKGGGQGHHAAPVEPGEAPLELDEAEAAAVWTELEAARARATLVTEDTNFYVFVHGGVWTELHLGRAADKCSCLARGHAKRWCDTYLWPKQKGFSYNEYGEEVANKLAEEWQARSHHFYKRWLAEGHGDYGYRFTAVDRDSYQPSDEFAIWASSIDMARMNVWRRITEVMNAFPVHF